MKSSYRQETAADILMRRKLIPVSLLERAELRSGEVCVVDAPYQSITQHIILLIAVNHLVRGGSVFWISVLSHFMHAEFLSELERILEAQTSVAQKGSLKDMAKQSLQSFIRTEIDDIRLVPSAISCAMESQKLNRNSKYVPLVIVAVAPVSAHCPLNLKVGGVCQPVAVIQSGNDRCPQEANTLFLQVRTLDSRCLSCRRGERHHHQSEYLIEIHRKGENLS